MNNILYKITFAVHTSFTYFVTKTWQHSNEISSSLQKAARKSNSRLAQLEI